MAPSFSKPVDPMSGTLQLGPRQRTTSSRLTSSENISRDAKKQILEQASRGNKTASPSVKPSVQQKINFTSKPTHTPSSLNNNKSPTRHSSVEIEEIPDQDAFATRHAGTPKSPTSLLEAADGSDDADIADDLPIRVATTTSNKRKKAAAEPEVEVVAEDNEAPSKKKKTETAEEELG